ncbi:MAG: squalene/phytoene synthase family protein [Gemmatimonadota bacterium]
MSPGGPDLRVERVREHLTRAADVIRTAGLPVPSLRGSLHRPVTVTLAAGGRPLPESTWMGALALEMVHEASLLHDDVLDGAEIRRGRPTLVAERGVAAALVEGDHLLTGAYVVAQHSGRPSFVSRFAEAVFATVDGERSQGRRAGEALGVEAYRAIVARKTGALFGCAAFLGACGSDDDADPEWVRFGCDLGVLYQRVDDLLDYVPAAATGKAAFQDRRQQKWTWPLAHASAESWAAADGPCHRALSACVAELRDEAEALVDRGARLGADVDGVVTLTERWLAPVLAAVPTGGRWPSAAVTAGRARVEERVRTLDSADARAASFRLHSRSFSFAARLFPPEPRRRVAGVYGFCRFTDDLVDRADPLHPQRTLEDLDAWLGMASDAYHGRASGCVLVDSVMRDMVEHDVPFHYVRELVAGMRMDLEGRTYETMTELRLYTYRVASVVGGWLTELFGTHDPWVLERAAALGHAMQLTNILRDVGEDLRAGRLYLPASQLGRHGLTRADLEGMSDGERPIDARYRVLVQEMMAIAEADYDAAFEAIPHLPVFFQRPVAVAARVYMGIHEGIRRNGYDNLRRRAYTRVTDKLRLAGVGLWELGRARRNASALPPLRSGRGEPWIPPTVDREAVA